MVSLLPNLEMERRDSCDTQALQKQEEESNVFPTRGSRYSLVLWKGIFHTSFGKKSPNTTEQWRMFVSLSANGTLSLAQVKLFIHSP